MRGVVEAGARWRRGEDVGQVGHHAVEVAGELAQRGLPFGDRLLQRGAQLQHRVRVEGRGGQQRHARQPVGVQQPAQVGQDLRQFGGGQPVGLVEHDDGDVAVPVELAQVAVVHHPVGVLLRVDHPDDQVDQGQQPVDLQPVRLAARSRSRAGRAGPGRAAPTRRRRRAALSRMKRCRGSTPIQSRSWLAPSSGPQTQACATPVVGRRTPTGERSSRASGVEEAGLAAAGGAGERDDGVVAGECQPGAGAFDQGARRAEPVVRQVAVDGVQEAAQRVEPGQQHVGVDRLVRAQPVPQPAHDVAHRSPSSTPMVAIMSRIRPARGPGLGKAELAVRGGDLRGGGAQALGRRTGFGGDRGQRGVARRLLREQGVDPGRAGRRGPAPPGSAPPGRRRSPGVPSGRRRRCRRRWRPPARWG